MLKRRKYPYLEPNNPFNWIYARKEYMAKKTFVKKYRRRQLKKFLIKQYKLRNVRISMQEVARKTGIPNISRWANFLKNEGNIMITYERNPGHINRIAYIEIIPKRIKGMIKLLN